MAFSKVLFASLASAASAATTTTVSATTTAAFVVLTTTGALSNVTAVTTAAAGGNATAGATTAAAGGNATATTAAAAVTTHAATMAATKAAAANGTTAAGSVSVTELAGIKMTSTVPYTAAANTTRRQLSAVHDAACKSYVDLVLSNANAKTAYAAKMLALEPLKTNAGACEVTKVAVATAGCVLTGANLKVTASYTLQVTPKAGVTNAAMQAALTGGKAALTTASTEAGKVAVSSGVANMSAGDKATFAKSIGKTAADINAAWATSVAATALGDASGSSTTTISITTSAPHASGAFSAAFGVFAAIFSAALLF